MGIKTTENLTLILKLLRKMQKMCKQKVTGKRSVQNWSLSSSSVLLTCKNLWKITFSRYTFFKLFPWLLNQRKILRFFDTHILKKEIQKFWGIFLGNSRMQIRKKWLIQMTIFFNKHFKDYYLALFGW
jgi:hypothetical protein